MHSTDDRARWLARYVLPHEPALRSWLSRRQVVGLEIDDIVQDTYARLSSAASVDDIRDPRNYMFRTAYSVIVTHLRRSRIVEMQSFAQFESEDFIDDLPGPETVAMDRDELCRIGEAIAHLPPRVREVFVMRRVEGLRQRDIAARLGVSESTVEKQMMRAIRELADRFGRGGKRRSGASRLELEGKHEPHAAGDKPGD